MSPTGGAVLPLLELLPAETRGRLLSASTVRELGAGQAVCRQGEPADQLTVVETGQARVSSVTTSGRELLVDVAEAPVAFDKAALVHRTCHASTARVLGPARVRVIPGSRLLTAVAECPAASRQLMRHLAAVARDRHDRLVDLAGLDVSARLARWLLHQAERRGCGASAGFTVPLSLTQADLAGLLGTTRVSVNRALRDLAASGAIRRTPHGVVILRPSALAALL